MLATELAVDLTRELQKKWLTFQSSYLYTRIKSEMSSEEPTQTKYNSLVESVIAEYGKNKQLAKKEIMELEEEIKKYGKSLSQT